MKNINDVNLQEIIDFLKKNPKTKVNAMISEERKGYFQIDNEKEYEEYYVNTFKQTPVPDIDIANGYVGDILDEDGDYVVETDYDDDDNEFLTLNTKHYQYEYHKKSIDLKKKIYSGYFYDWINFEINVNWLIEQIEENYNEKERLENTIKNFKNDCWSDYNTPDAAMANGLDGIELDSGLGTDTGRNEISWNLTNEYGFSNIDLKFV